jgi:hypothetical protein
VILRRVSRGVDVLDDPEIEEPVAIDVGERGTRGVVLLPPRAARRCPPARGGNAPPSWSMTSGVSGRYRSVWNAVNTSRSPSLSTSPHAHRYAGPHASTRPGHDAGRLGDVLEGSVAAIPERATTTRAPPAEKSFAASPREPRGRASRRRRSRRIDARSDGHQHVEAPSHRRVVEGDLAGRPRAVGIGIAVIAAVSSSFAV